MAKNKADYIAEGTADALAGKPRKAIAAATWQAAAYDAAYTDAVKMAQAKLGIKQQVRTANGVVTIHTRVHRDAKRRLDATLKRYAHRVKMNSFNVRPAPKRFLADPVTQSWNIRRANR